MNDNVFLWLKLETGGLSGVTESGGLGFMEYPVLDVSAVVTDCELVEISRYRSAIWQSGGDISRCSPVALQMHTESGLLAEVESSGTNLEDAEDAIIRLLVNAGAQPYTKHASQVAFMAGQNISSHESLFVSYQMRRLKQFLHFTTFDIAALSVASGVWGAGGQESPQAWPDLSGDYLFEKQRFALRNAKGFRDSLFSGRRADHYY